MAILVFKKTLTLQEAEALTKLAKGAIFNSHHNWERNVRSTFDSSNPSLEVRQVAHIISEFIRKPAYCFIFAHGKDVESSFIRIKDADDFLGVVSEKMESDSNYRREILEKVNDLGSIIQYDALKADGDDMNKFAEDFLEKINNTELKDTIGKSDAKARKDEIRRLMYELHAIDYFQK